MLKLFYAFFSEKYIYFCIEIYIHMDDLGGDVSYTKILYMLFNPSFNMYDTSCNKISSSYY